MPQPVVLQKLPLFQRFGFRHDNPWRQNPLPAEAALH